MSTLLETSRTGKPTLARGEKISRGGIPMKLLNDFRSEVARQNRENNKIVKKMLDAGFKLA